MPLDPKQERYVRRFFPGLIEDVKQLGQGDFAAQLPMLWSVGTRGIRGANLHLAYSMIDGTCIDIRISSRLRAGEPPHKITNEADASAVDLTKWDRIHYSLHYGPAGGCDFRFDLDAVSGHHVHLKPNTNAHAPVETVVPNVKNMEPEDFVKMVAKFRKDGIYPVRKKT